MKTPKNRPTREQHQNFFYHILIDQTIQERELCFYLILWDKNLHQSTEVSQDHKKILPNVSRTENVL